MFSFFHEEREAHPYQELRVQVRRIFDLIKAGEYEPFTSSLTINEIANEPNDEKKHKMAELVSAYNVKLLDITDETTELAAMYIQAGAVSAVYKTDAMHIAIAAVNGLDFIVSLNFTHIVRPWTIERVRRMNVRENYQGLGIYKPAEVLEIYEDGTELSK